MTYKVTAPMVTVRTDNARIVYLYLGDVVPDGVFKDSLEHLKTLGFVAGDAAAAATLIDQPDGGAQSPVVGGDVPKPAGNAGLDEWTLYARSQGASDADLDGLSRNDVRDLYK